MPTISLWLQVHFPELASQMLFAEPSGKLQVQAMEIITNYQHIFQQYFVLVFYHTCTIRKVFKTLFTFIALSPFNVGSTFTLSIFLVTNLSFRSFLVAITNFRNILENVIEQSFFLYHCLHNLENSNACEYIGHISNQWFHICMDIALFLDHIWCCSKFLAHCTHIQYLKT